MLVLYVGSGSLGVFLSGNFWCSCFVVVYVLGLFNGLIVMRFLLVFWKCVRVWWCDILKDIVFRICVSVDFGLIVGNIFGWKNLINLCVYFICVFRFSVCFFLMESGLLFCVVLVMLVC